VYVRQQKDADSVREFLSGHGHNAVAYHAGKDSQTRAAIQVLSRMSKSEFVYSVILRSEVRICPIRRLHGCIGKELPGFVLLP